MAVVVLSQLLNKSPLIRLNAFASVPRVFSSNFTTIDVEGNHIKVETGNLAKMADGSAVVTMGDTSVLVTTVCKPRVTNYAGFLPLTVDYRHKWAAAGRIPTNYYRRDLGPSEFEILTSRMIDRSIRPLFAKGFGHDVQLSCNVLSLDSSNDPCVAAINAASTSLLLSDVPWAGPVASVRLAFDADANRCLINPTRRALKNSPLNVVVSATLGKRIIMLDGDASDLPSSKFLDCLRIGLEHTEKIATQLLELKAKHGKQIREGLTKLFLPAEDLLQKIVLLSEMRLCEIYDDPSHDKLSRDRAVQNLRAEIVQHIKDSVYASNSQSGVATDQSPEVPAIELAFNQVCQQVFRRRLFETGRRCDGRSIDQLRSIKCQVGLYDSLHGSSVFQRGQTQVLCTLTLDSMEAALRNDAVAVFLGALKEKMFMLTYEFPAYANNELGSGGRFNRRELGHGALAEKALRPLIPSEFPFATRLACEVLESNGSSSMASVCAGSLALMDGGVPIKAPAAGIAMGLMSIPTDSEQNANDYKILTDINGLEDYAGDMDFKISGTRNGLTALQLDVRTQRGLSLEQVDESLSRAFVGLNDILDITSRQALSAPRAQISLSGPAVEEFVVPVTKRYRMMRMGGYNVRKLESDLGVQITRIDQQTYRIFASNKSLLAEAKDSLQQMLERGSDQTKDLEFGAIYKGRIVEILENGIGVTLSPDDDPIFVPNSQLDVRHVKHASVLGFAVNDEIMVKYFGRDPVSGAVRLSRKLLQKTAGSSNDVICNFERKAGSSRTTIADDGAVEPRLSPWSKTVGQ